MNFPSPDPPARRIQSIVGCARCHGLGHESLEFEELIYPVSLTSKVIATHWAMCPAVQQPILMAFMTMKEVKNMHKEETDLTPEPEQERDLMEDSRPAEPGTVGDNLEDVAPDAEPDQGDSEE